ncbi:MAG: element excision factor XisI family protein [Saprospiraceae bacterium]
MDKTIKYQKIVLQLLDTWKGYKISNRPNLKIDIIVNKAMSNFIVLNYGWDNDNYIYNVLFHVELKTNNKIWLHEDTTGVGIAKELIHLGINEKDLVLGFVEVLDGDLVLG